MNKAIDYGFDGMIVYEDKAGKPPEFFAAGWHDRKKKYLPIPHDLFKIASIGKLYDAVAFTKLVHDKNLVLDKTLTYNFPEFD